MEKELLQHKEITRLYCLSDPAFRFLLYHEIIMRDGRLFYTPWGRTWLLKPSHVAKLLGYTSARKVLYEHSGLFFDLHCEKSERACWRIALHDFQTLVEESHPELLAEFKSRFKVQLSE